MVIESIISHWKSLGITLNPLTSKNVSNYGLSNETIQFLSTCGFPSQSPPFLSFVVDSEEPMLSINCLTELYFDYNLSNDMDRYIVIGSDGGGNPIVINTEKGGQIEILDHESDFETIHEMNSSVFTLSQSLVAYKRFIITINKENGPDAFSKSYFTNKQYANLKNELLSINDSLIEYGFWEIILENLLNERQ